MSCFSFSFLLPVVRSDTIFTTTTYLSSSNSIRNQLTLFTFTSSPKNRSSPFLFCFRNHKLRLLSLLLSYLLRFKDQQKRKTIPPWKSPKTRVHSIHQEEGLMKKGIYNDLTMDGILMDLVHVLGSLKPHPMDLKLELFSHQELVLPGSQQWYLKVCFFVWPDDNGEATKDAGRISGLEVLCIILEPAVASLAYGFERKSNETILVLTMEVVLLMFQFLRLVMESSKCCLLLEIHILVVYLCVFFFGELRLGLLILLLGFPRVWLSMVF